MCMFFFEYETLLLEIVPLSVQSTHYYYAAVVVVSILTKQSV